MESLVTRQVTPNSAKKSIVRAFKKKRPIFMWGPPGIGKSDIIGQVANELGNSHLIDIRLSLWDPTDIKGMPYYSESDNTMKWAPPAELPTEEFAAQFDFVSELLEDDDDETTTDLISGSVGEGLAVKFMAHRKVASSMPNPTDILAGKVKELKTKEISAMYSLTVSLCYELKEASDKNDKKFDDKVSNFLRFAMDNFETELVVMGIRLAITQYQLPIDPDEVECFDEFHERYGKYIQAANGS